MIVYCIIITSLLLIIIIIIIIIKTFHIYFPAMFSLPLFLSLSLLPLKNCLPRIASDFLVVYLVLSWMLWFKHHSTCLNLARVSLQKLLPAEHVCPDMYVMTGVRYHSVCYLHVYHAHLFMLKEPALLIQHWFHLPTISSPDYSWSGANSYWFSWAAGVFSVTSWPGSLQTDRNWNLQFQYWMQWARLRNQRIWMMLTWLPQSLSLWRLFQKSHNFF